MPNNEFVEFTTASDNVVMLNVSNIAFIGSMSGSMTGANTEIKMIGGETLRVKEEYLVVKEMLCGS
jgi:hypothetical protein